MVLETSIRPASCSPLAPMIATAIASSHMRMRFQSPMPTMSDTAPMVQKRVLFPTAPKTNASPKPPQTTQDASAAGSAAVTRLLAHEALSRLFRGPARRLFLHERAEGLPRRLAVAHLRLVARDIEQRIGRLGVVRPGAHDLLLRGDRRLVVAHRVVRIADPVLRVRSERAVRIAREEVLEPSDRKLVVAQLELAERRLVGPCFRRGVPLALRELILQLRVRLLHLAHAVVEVDVQVLL